MATVLGAFPQPLRKFSHCRRARTARHVIIRPGFAAKSAKPTNEKIGVGRALPPPPSEPDVRISRIRLSSRWFTSVRTDARTRKAKRTVHALQRAPASG